MNLHADLSKGLQTLQIDVTQEQHDQLIAFLYLLQKWNKHFNLTAVRDIEKMLSMHLFDSLSIASFVQGEKVLDVGTGAGLPGIPLSILFPDKIFSLLDSNGKKIRFCRQAIHELSLKNTTAHQVRVEQFQPEETFDVITTRALTDLPNMMQLLKPVMAPKSVLLAMKGVLPEQEMQTIKKLGFQIKEEKLQVPEISGQRHVLLIKQSL